MNSAPADDALRTELIDALTDNRADTPALRLSQTVTLPPAQRRRLALNAAAEMVRLADVPARSETERLQLAQAALNRYDERCPAGKTNLRLRRTLSGPVSIGLARFTPTVIIHRSSGNIRR